VVPVPGADERVYTVSELTALVKEVLETSLPVFWVEGELSNYVHHTSGHMYFTLKDDRSQIPCIMFKFANAKLRFTPEHGMKVLAWGRIKVYEPAGKYQLTVEQMRPAGVGDLAARFEELKGRLAAEGLFDPAHKKPIPKFPGTLAVITSPTGAAVRDVIRVVGGRFPAARIVVVPTPVQGPEAAPGIIDSLALVDEWGEADVAILTRGGGSLEDLWTFNDEAVARAIYRARTPVISAVGHEVDFTIADFVADLRAATPSNAGELAVPDRADLARSIGSLSARLGRAALMRIDRLSMRIAACKGSYGLNRPQELVERWWQTLDGQSRRLSGEMRNSLARARTGLDHALAELKLVDPSHILARGFAAVRVLPGLTPLRSVSDVRAGSEIRLSVVDGAIDAAVGSVARKTEVDR
jgi:exodeoxyribonuclease VII large subunit